MKIKEILKQREEYIKLRYQKLYGANEYEEYLKRDKQALRKQCVILGVLLLTVIALWILLGITNKPVIREGKKQEIIEVQRPPKGGKTTTLDTKIWAVKDGKTVSVNREIVIEPHNSKNTSDVSAVGSETKEQILERKLSGVSRGLNKDTSKIKVRLPRVLKDGTKIFWQKQEKNYLTLIIFSVALWVLFFGAGRYRGIKKEEREAKASIIREIPEFINKLVLLMEGGIVLQETFDRIIADYKTSDVSNNYFYEQLSQIRHKVKNTNCVMYEELMSFAKRSGIKELMRFASVICDSAYKGNDMSEKLRKEGRMLWFERKKQCEKSGRIAESKLTFPLMILILVLIMITVAPAMINM